MSAPTMFAPLEIARETLANRRFSSTADHTKTHGTASNKRDAAELWLDYVGEGCNPWQASTLLRQNGPKLGYTANDIATGTRVARHCLKVGYSQTDRTDMTRLTVPVSELARVIEFLDMRPHFVGGFGGQTYQNGYVSRGATAIAFANGEQLAVRLLPGDPRTEQIEALIA